MPRRSACLLVACFLLLAASPAWADRRRVYETGMISRGNYNMRVVVRDNRGYPVHSSSGACVRTMGWDRYDACAPLPCKHVPRAVLAQEERTVFFAFDSAELTEEAQRRLDRLMEVLRQRGHARAVRISGYADRLGSAEYNEKLSRRRAEAVRDYLFAQGNRIPSVIETRWFGKSRPTSDCPEPMPRRELIACLQQDRRVDVEINYEPDLRAENESEL